MKPNPVGLVPRSTCKTSERAHQFYETVFRCQLEPMAAPRAKPAARKMLDGPTTMRRLAGGMLVQMADCPRPGGKHPAYFACTGLLSSRLRRGGRR